MTRHEILSEIDKMFSKLCFLKAIEFEAYHNGPFDMQPVYTERILQTRLKIIELKHKLRTI